MPRLPRGRFALVGAVLLGVACAEYVVAPGERAPRGIQLDSSAYAIDEGQRVNVVATVLDQFGAPFTRLPAGVSIGWSSSDTAVARVDTAGVLTGVTAGAAKVGAAVRGDFGAFDVSADVTVRPLVTAIGVAAGDSQAGTVGQALAARLAVRVTNRLGAGVRGVTVNFSVKPGGGTLDTASTTTDTAGLATTGLTLGTAAGVDSVEARTPRLIGAVVTFVARANPGLISALAKVSGDSQSAATGAALGAPLVVRALDRYGNVVPGVTVAWAPATGGGSVAPTSGVTDARGTASAQWTLGTTRGAQTATASVGGTLSVTFSATATARVSSVTVTPNPVTLASGATQQLTATASDSGGSPIPGKTAIWASSDSTVARVNATGLVTAVKAGTATITATVDGIGGTSAVTVTPGPASTATSQVGVSAATVIVGGAATFTLTTRDAAGNALTSGGLTVGFSTSGGTSAGTIGPVSDKANGTYTATYTATAAGTAVTVGATIGGQPVTSTLPTVQVLADTVVASVTVAPALDTLASGTSVQLVATARNAAGVALAGKPVSWATSASGVAGVSSTGLVTGALAGTATITATVQGVSGTAAVTVVPGAPSTATSFVTVSSSTVTVGGAVGLKLTTRDAAGNALTRGGHTVLFTQSGGTSAGTIGAVTDSANGAYGATFTATTAGTPVAIGATIDGQPVASASPPTIQVNPGNTNLVHWINPAGGAWSTAGNWNPARVPTVQDTAVVDAAGTYLVTNAGTGVGGLVIGAAGGAGAQVRFTGDTTVPGAVLVRAGATLDLQANLIVGSFQNDGTILVESAEAGPVALAVDSVGVRTAVNNGTIETVSGSVVNVARAPAGLLNHGTLSPGVPASSGPIAQMTIAGNVTFSTGSVVSIDLGGAGFQQADALGITGTATLGDTLSVQLLFGYVPNIGDSFGPVVWTAFAGSFGTIKLPATVAGGMWQTSYTPAGLILSVVAVPAPTVSVFQGDGQSAPVGSSVTTPPAVRYVDAASNPVVGASVTFAVASGGGSIIGPATVTTDASGVAQVGGWQLGPAPGTNTLTATVAGSGIRGNPVTFTATGTPTALTWTGAVSTDWSNAGNWSPAIVPGAANDVSIGPATNEPTLTASSAANNVTISGNGAILRIGGQTLSVAALTTTNFGLLIMTNPADVVSVTGMAYFDGGNENGGLTAGVLQVGGTFYENVDYDPRSFAASGTHRVVFTGSSLQTVTLVDLTGSSHFQDVDISSSAGINIQGDFNGVALRGTFISQPTGAATPMLYALGRSLSAQRLQVSRLVVDDCALIVNEGSTALSQQLDNVTFQNFRYVITTTTRTQLTLSLQGASPSRLLTFNALTFVPLTTGSSGYYLNLTSNGGATALTVNGSNVTNGPAFTLTSANATVTWQ